MIDYLKYLPIVTVAIIYVVRMMEIAKKRNLIKGEVKEATTLFLFKMVGLFTVVAGTLEYIFLRFYLNLPLLLIGVMISFFSFYLRRRAIAALGKFWSLHVEIRENHEFVKTGPFRFVRHPAYSSMVLEILAVAIILCAPITLALALSSFLLILNRRIKLEETELEAKFGKAYQDYKINTPALFPRISK